MLDSGFQSPGFRIPQAKNSWIPESEVPYMGRNFLISDRQQRVRLSGQYSSMKTIMKGVFRRSTLGLILFIIFMNDQMNAHYSRMPITLNCLRWLDWIFLGGYLPSLSLNYVGMSKDMEKKVTTTVLYKDENFL